jgi:twitching motility protein PilT
MFRTMVDMEASDLHLVVGAPPQLRVRGAMVSIEGYDALTPEDVREIVFGILTNEQRQRLEVQWEIDFSYAVPGLARWRVNAFFQRGAVGAAFRIIPETIKSLGDLGVPDAVFEFAKLSRGLVLVTGPTGSGKSTTLAGIIDVINEQRNAHILTVEDPIEFIHPHKNSIINQREVGSDTDGFARALKSALRQDPDVILVGEMRDLETIQTALTAAETGHLVFGTLHTSTAAKTIDRIIDVFPPYQQEQVRVQLSSSLMGVVTQVLVPTRDNLGRVLASEIMIPNNAVRNLIREGKIFQIPSVMQTSQGEGMQTLDAALSTLVRSNQITAEEAMKRTHEPEEFARLLQNGGGAPPAGRTPYMRPDNYRLQSKVDASMVASVLDGDGYGYDGGYADHGMGGGDPGWGQQPADGGFNPLTAQQMPMAPAVADPMGAPAAGFAPAAPAMDPAMGMPPAIDPATGMAAPAQGMAPAMDPAAAVAPAIPGPTVPGQMPELPVVPGAFAPGAPAQAAPASAYADQPVMAEPAAAAPAAQGEAFPPAADAFPAAPEQAAAAPAAAEAQPAAVQVPIDPATGQPWQPPGEVA